MRPRWVTRTGKIHLMSLLQKNNFESLQWDSIGAETKLHQIVRCAWWGDKPTNPSRVLLPWQKWGSLESAEDVCGRGNPPCRQLLWLCQLRIQLFLGSPKREDSGHCESKLYHQVSFNGNFFLHISSPVLPTRLPTDLALLTTSWPPQTQMQSTTTQRVTSILRRLGFTPFDFHISWFFLLGGNPNNNGVQ